MCHCILIIIGTKLSSAVTTELNDESRCYSSGSLIDDTLKYLQIKEILTGLGSAFARTDKPTLDLIGTDFMQQICRCFMF
eukprot:jgi/Galph1/2987/GphlegSOOS_G1651.1